MAELEEADPVPVSEDLWLVAGILALQQAKKRVEVRPVNQGIVVVLSSFVELVYASYRFEPSVAFIRWKCRGGG